MPFTFSPTEIPEVLEIESKIFPDERGAFAEVFKQSDFQAAGITEPFLQVNNSRSAKNVLRGLHYQMNPHAQGKLVHVPFGEIFDVAVDIRVGSPTFGKWVSAVLSDKKKNMLFVPAGFAHGFYVMSNGAEVIYHCTKEYAFEHEGGIIWNDPTIGIEWPAEAPLLSEKDEAFPLLEDAQNNFTFDE